jgi:hypothetical protein
LLATILIETDFCKEFNKNMMTHRGHGMLLVPNTFVDETEFNNPNIEGKNQQISLSLRVKPITYTGHFTLHIGEYR